MAGITTDGIHLIAEGDLPALVLDGAAIQLVAVGEPDAREPKGWHIMATLTDGRRVFVGKKGGSDVCTFTRIETVFATLEVIGLPEISVPLRPEIATRRQLVDLSRNAI